MTLRPGVSPAWLGAGAERLLPGSRTYLVGLDARTGLAALRANAGVVDVEINRRRSRLAGDPLVGSQTFLRQIDWTPQTVRRRPVVAVLDTGVDATHPDLAGRLLPGKARSFIGDSPLVDRSGHGTHVAGVIAATAGNGIGGAGVSNARLLVVKVADAAGDADTASLVRGIRYAVASGAKVINISLGGSGFSRLERDAILDARRAGALVVVAAGNGGRSGSPREYPGAYRHVLSVSAVRSDGRAIIDSTRGPQVALAAPGKAVLSTAPKRRYLRRTGTSMAAAVVSGTAARVLAERPALDVSQLEAVLTGSARDVGAPGRDDDTGAGIVNLAAALAAAPPPADRPEPDDDPSLVGSAPAFLEAGADVAEAAASVTQWSDPADDYRVRLAAGERITVTATGEGTLDPDLVVWRPGAPAFVPGAQYVRDWLAGSSLRPGAGETLAFTASETGVHAVEVQAGAGSGRYRLSIRREPALTP